MDIACHREFPDDVMEVPAKMQMTASGELEDCFIPTMSFDEAKAEFERLKAHIDGGVDPETLRRFALE